MLTPAAPIRVESVGRPTCLSRLAAMMLRLQAQNARPALRLVEPASNDAPRPLPVTDDAR